VRICYGWKQRPLLALNAGPGGHPLAKASRMGKTTISTATITPNAIAITIRTLAIGECCVSIKLVDRKVLYKVSGLLFMIILLRRSKISIS
jgi:hypothetical protein